MTKGKIDQVLANWLTLNDFIADAVEDDCDELLVAERNGKNRTQFMLRIHSRKNRQRADRERKLILRNMPLAS